MVLVVSEPNGNSILKVHQIVRNSKFIELNVRCAYIGNGIVRLSMSSWNSLLLLCWSG